MAEELGNIKIYKPNPGFQERFISSDVDFLVAGSGVGVGKEQPLSAHVLTPDGWKRMGDMKAGDIVCTPDGKIANVVKLFPQGVKDVYEIRTDDGRMAECGIDHLWKVRTNAQLSALKRYGKDSSDYSSVLRTEEIIEGMKSGKDYWIPLAAPEFAEKEYVIPPYVLGVLLGDGCLTPSVLTEGTNCITISNSEDDIIRKVSGKMDGIRTYYNQSNSTRCIYTPHIKEYRAYLKHVGLNTYSYNKHIPEEYLFGSRQQRLDLLKGLFDTDGNVGLKNRFNYYTTSHDLKCNIVTLCRSLGIVANVTLDNRCEKYTTKGPCYKISFHTDTPIFSSDKHMKKYLDNIARFPRAYSRDNGHIKIESIKLVRQEESQCIMLDSDDHLYVTDDYITTHNTFAALMLAGAHCEDPNFRMAFLRRNIGDLKAAGGGTDEAQKLYAGICTFKISESPRMTFPSGAFVDFTHMSEQNEEKLLERIKGWQYSCIYIDEATGFEWSTIRLLMSRNRSQAKWTGKMRMTCNPKRNHWLRKWVDWYVDAQGYPIPDRVGVVRYFYVNGKDIDDVVFGDTKEEVYAQCRIQIDETLKSQGNTFSYKDLIKSTTFYTGKLAENKALIENDPTYLGSAAAMGEKQRLANLMSCWNVDLDEDLDTPIKSANARKVADNDPQQNGVGWIVADLADIGTDNLLMLHTNGLHIDDIFIRSKTTPKENAEYIKRFAIKHNVPDSHILYDGNRAPYMLDYMPDAVAVISTYAPRGKYRRDFQLLKDELYMRLVRAVNEGRISMSADVAKLTYEHVKLKTDITVLDEFVEECNVVQFYEAPNGKKRLFSKKEMNAKLGKSRSMDLLDPCAMLFYPCLMADYGEELWFGTKAQEEDDDNEADFDIYDDSSWF
jgi:hypothetical protein